MSDSPSQPLKRTEVGAQTQLPAKAPWSGFATPASEDTVVSVEQLNVYIKQLLEGQVGTVWVRGELSNFKAHTSGHFYFSLKDSKSQVTAVMFRGHNAKLKFKPHDGLEVLVRGRITVYEPRGNYQLMCEVMEPVGAGALQKSFEQLKAKLKSEGLFEAEKKRPIPSLPRHIAIVTSPTGAAIRDILNVLSRRAKGIQVTVVPSIVQGEAAAPQLREAFQKASSLPGVDVVIIGRGGGSIEDMWCFNDEALARLIAASPIPVISAVGHEIDFTISDFVADLRAPTPSAAAELVAKSSSELSHRVDSFDRLLNLALKKVFRSYLERVNLASKRLVDPKRRLQDLQLKNDDLLNRLEFATQKYLKDFRHEVVLLKQKLGSPQDIILDKKKDLQHLSARMQKSQGFLLEKKQSRLQRVMSVLDSLSPLKVVERGYSIVSHNKKIIKSAGSVKPGDLIEVRLAEGSLAAAVTSVKEKTDGL